jgi:probable rRNA maturation factor
VAEPRYDVEIDEAVALPAGLATQRFTELATRVMTGEDVAAGATLTIRFCDDDEIRQLNRDFLGNDRPTDVLSFPGEPEDFPRGENEPFHLGDLAISVPTAERQARDIGHDPGAEIEHLLVHGVLHLCGYDHEESPEEELHMRAREEVYLGDLTHVHSAHES